jgi:phospholipid/cholesterol/gamma-HCH transport system substrate-binding protein
METKANYTLIGLFTVAVIAAVFGFIFWFQNIGGTGERVYYQIAFDGSVSGLRTGASVLFNGIRVGEVTGLKLNPDKPQQVVAVVSVDKAVAIRPDTQIGLEFQGLTGIASIALSGGSADRPVLVGSRDNPPLMIAPPNATSDITQAARETLRKLDDFIGQNQQALHSALINIDKFTKTLADNSDRFNNALVNIDKFTGALGRNSERIDKITAGLQTLSGGEDGKSGDLVDMVRSITRLADNLDKRTEEITKGINVFTAAGTKQINVIGSDAHRMIGEVEKTVRNIDRNPSRLLFGGASEKK